MRCPDCNKFVSFDAQEPELTLEVELQYADKEPAEATVSGSVRCVLACGECGTELKDAEMEVEETVELVHIPDAESHEVSLDAESADPSDRVENKDRHGKLIKNSRYMKTFYGADISVTVSCTCGASADANFNCEEQASGFNELV